MKKITKYTIAIVVLISIGIFTIYSGLTEGVVYDIARDFMVSYSYGYLILLMAVIGYGLYLVLYVQSIIFGLKGPSKGIHYEQVTWYEYGKHTPEIGKSYLVQYEHGVSECWFVKTDNAEDGLFVLRSVDEVIPNPIAYTFLPSGIPYNVNI